MDAEQRAKFDAKLEEAPVVEVNGRPVPEGVDVEEQEKLARQLAAIFQMPQAGV